MKKLKLEAPKYSRTNLEKPLEGRKQLDRLTVHKLPSPRGAAAGLHAHSMKQVACRFR
jgi:hypothetical protein